MAEAAPSLEPAQRASTGVPLSIALTIAALYFGSDIFVPIAISILLSFVLAPGVRLLRRWHLGRVVPVLAMATLAVVAIASISAAITLQLRDLTTDLPRYEDTVRRKIEAVRGMSEGRLKRLTDLVSILSQDLSRKSDASETVPGLGGAPAKPIPVVVRAPEPTTLDTLGRILAPLLHPLATLGIVVVFVIFILLQREDLRNRLIRLVGAGDLHRSTAALDDAARRLSRLLVSQLALNTAAGLLVGAALWAIGVPSPGLWGILFGCLRFVPYLGPPLAAILPIGLAAAVDPGWGMTLWTIATFAIIESLVGQVIEPFLYGHNTGLSPVAIVLSATFWTALWGPIGLILSTPITVCLVVLGRHVDHLRVFDLLLGDRPPLTPSETFYQRMLANDPIEAADQAQQMLRQIGLTDYYDTVVRPGLLLAQEDVGQGRLDLDRQRRIAVAVAEVVDDLSDASADHESRSLPSLIGRIAGRAETVDEPAQGAGPLPDEARPAKWRKPGAVLCLGSRNPLDDAGAQVLAQLLGKHGFGVETASYDVLLNAKAAPVDLSAAGLIALSCFDGSSSAYLRFVLRRVRRRAPHAAVLVCAWWRIPGESGPVPEEAAGDAQVSTLPDALAFCLGHASAETLPQDAVSEPQSPDRAMSRA